MTWTKRQFIEQAYDEIGIASYNFDLEAEEIQSALHRLDSMLATWNDKGIRLGYPLPSTPEGSDIDAETGVPDRANEAIWSNLALRLASSNGKLASADLKQLAREAYTTLVTSFAFPQERQLPAGVVRGAGNKTWRGNNAPFTVEPDATIDAGPDGPLEFD